MSEALHLVFRWIHVVAGVLWLGLLWFLAFVHVQVVKTWDAEVTRKVLPELMPRAMFLSRLGAGFALGTGFMLLGIVYYGGGAIAEPHQARGLASGVGLGSVVFAFVVYDLLWRALGGRERLGVLLSLVLLAAASFGLSRVMSGRALFLHVGAMLGMIMVGNVMQRISPSQRRIVTAVAAGEPPPADAVRLANQRAKHNAYLAVPVLFFMTSNHFPLAYGSSLRWLLAPLFVLAGWAIARGLYGLSGRRGA